MMNGTPSLSSTRVRKLQVKIDRTSSNCAKFNVSKQRLYWTGFRRAKTSVPDHFRDLSSAFTRPLIVCCFASSAGFNPNSPRDLEVSGPMDASLIWGNLLSNESKSKRELKCSTVELLLKVIQSAPLSKSFEAVPLRSSVSGTVL